MSGEVWISEVFTNYEVGNRMGLRWKYPGGEWSSSSHVLDRSTPESLARFNAYREARRLAPEDVPEAAAIWEPSCFARTGDLFMASTMFALRPRLAEVFSRFDLGEGGLTPLTIYEADLQTPAKGEYYLLHLGARKQSFLPEQSNHEGYRVHPFYRDRKTGEQVWKIETLIGDFDVAVSSAALQGPDLWVEAHVSERLFMSGDLAEALINAGAKKADFRLKRCRVWVA